MENILPEKTFQKKKITKNMYEYAAWSNGSVICGVDEVGRGCLAGPVVTAAVILPVNKLSRLLKDSKLLSKDELLRGYTWITKHSWYGYGIMDNYQIDRFNIYQATLIAMKRAVMQALNACPFRPTSIVVDAMPLKLSFSTYHDIAIYSFPKGERLSSSIAAASIIAKVKRDMLIGRFDNIIPGYSFSDHKGYATETHRTAIQHEGRSLIHRSSFLGKVLYSKDGHGEQTNLF